MLETSSSLFCNLIINKIIFDQLYIFIHANYKYMHVVRHFFGHMCM